MLCPKDDREILANKRMLEVFFKMAFNFYFCHANIFHVPWKIFFMWATPTPHKFVPFSPPPPTHPLGISIDHHSVVWCMNVFWNHNINYLTKVHIAH